MLTVFPTTPEGRPGIVVDITDLLPAGAAFESLVVSCATHDESKVQDPAAAECLDGAYTQDGNLFRQYFHNGLIDVDYVVSFLFTWDIGEIEPIQVKLPVRKYLPH